MGGVGLLLSPKAKASLNYVAKVSDRVIVATSYSNTQLTVVSCYSPQSGADASDVESFYNDLSLREAITNVPTQPPLDRW